jgi:hypothetical protein
MVLLLTKRTSELAIWNCLVAMPQSSVVCRHSSPREARADELGKYFEVRYFLNVIVGSAHTSVSVSLSPIRLTSSRKLVTVQLPIVLIHMVS